MKLNEVNNVEDNNKNHIDDFYYYDLLPEDNVDVDSVYTKMLENLLSRNNVTNIAIMGSYGSGKSSFIETFKKYHSSHKYINISLASFNNNSNNDTIPNCNKCNINNVEISNKIKNKELNELELNILHQIFYTANPKDIPLSRYKRIIEISKEYLCIIIVLICFIPIYLGKVKFFNIHLSGFNNSIINLLTFILILICSIYLILKMISYLYKSLDSIKIKLNSKVGDIELNKSNLETVFDKNLEEILYFFEKTEYDIVIFEDIERFENIKIFEKIRELNHIINTDSRNKNKKVKFIYAVNDELFNESKERTKFFDAIIPIIPVSNSNNSCSMLTTLLKKSNINHKLNIKFLRKISIYLDDMRLLKNIVNEFVIYKQKLKELDLDDNKMFALIVFKNTMPSEFSNLQYNKGNVYNIFNKFKTIKENKIDEINEKIKAKEKDYQRIKDEGLKDEKELKIIIAETLLEKIPNNVNKFSIDNKVFDIKSFAESNINVEDLYNSIIKNVTVNYYNNEFNPTGQIYKLSDIENATDENKTFRKRYKDINLKLENYEDINSKEIDKLKEEKENINLLNIKDYILNYDDKFIKDKLNSDLLIFIIKNGYLAEDYADYMNYFYQGTFKINDKKFLLSINNNVDLQYDYILYNIKNIIDTLDEVDFKKKQILNYYLLNYLLVNCNKSSLYNRYLDIYIDYLIANFKESFNFIDGYINKYNGQSIIFVKMIVNKFKFFWKAIEELNLKNDIMNRYLLLILNNFETDDIKALSNESNLFSYIENKNDIFYIISENRNNILEKFKNLNIKFKNIKLSKLDDIKFFNDFCKSGCFEINNENITEILSIPFIKKDIPQNKYEAILNLGIEDLNNYINNNINIFIEKCLLVEKNDFEDYKAFIDIINIEYVSSTNLNKMLDTTKIIINNINDVKNYIWISLLEKFKLIVSWENIYCYYKTFKLDDYLVKYINQSNVYEKLENKKLTFYEPIGQIDINTFEEDIILNKDITSSTLEHITKSFITKIETLDFINVEFEKMKILLNKKIIQYNLENYKKIKNVYKELIPIYISNMHIKTFINNINEYELDSEDINNILLSDLSISKKYSILTNINNKDIIKCDNANIANILSTIILYDTSDNELITNTDTLYNILKLSTDINSKIIIINLYFINICQIEDKEYIKKCLKLLEKPYCELSTEKNWLFIENNSNNIQLLLNLKTYDYIKTYKISNEKIRVYNKN